MTGQRIKTIRCELYAVALVGENRHFQGCEHDARLVKAASVRRMAEGLAGRRAEMEPELATV